MRKMITIFVLIPVAMASCEQKVDNSSSQEKACNHRKTALDKEILFKESGLVKDHYFGYTPLMQYVYAEYYTKVKNELANGADVNWKMEWGLTALMWASDKGNTRIAEVLINHGADVNAQNEDGMTALMLAAREGRTETVELLLKHKADTSIKDRNGFTAADHAMNNAHLDIVKLVQTGSDQ